MFWHNEEYATGLADITLDGVVCVVDAVFGKNASFSIYSDEPIQESYNNCSKWQKIIIQMTPKSESPYG